MNLGVTCLIDLLVTHVVEHVAKCPIFKDTQDFAIELLVENDG